MTEQSAVMDDGVRFSPLVWSCAMAFTQADLDRINSAIATGERRVKFSDREVEYRDIPDMLRAKSAIEKEIAVSAGTISRLRVIKYEGF